MPQSQSMSQSDDEETQVYVIFETINILSGDNQDKLPVLANAADTDGLDDLLKEYGISKAIHKEIEVL